MPTATATSTSATATRGPVRRDRSGVPLIARSTESRTSGSGSSAWWMRLRCSCSTWSTYALASASAQPKRTACSTSLPRRYDVLVEVH